jgi:hypothetical protein
LDRFLPKPRYFRPKWRQYLKESYYAADVQRLCAALRETGRSEAETLAAEIEAAASDVGLDAATSAAIQEIRREASVAVHSPPAKYDSRDELVADLRLALDGNPLLSTIEGNVEKWFGVYAAAYNAHIVVPLRHRKRDTAKHGRGRSRK